MDAVAEKSMSTNSYKMSYSERENITKQLEDALKMNLINPKTEIWDSNEYRKKYSILGLLLCCIR